MIQEISSAKILITGGCGFIGSHLVKMLVNSNKIVIFDSHTSLSTPIGKMGLLNHPNIKIVHGNLVCAEDLAILDVDFDYVIHAAGFLGINKVQEEPVKTMQINGIGTYNILECMLKQNKLKRFVYFSTSEIYGTDSLNVAESSDAIIPTVGIRWNYACSKLFGEYLVKSFTQQYSIPCVIVRPFNVYGPYRYSPYGIGTILRNAMNDEVINISGDGKQTRSWCHINDFVLGIYACLVNENIIGEAFNIGNNSTNISMSDLASLIVKITSSKSKIVIANNKIEDVRNRQADLSKSAHLLNYTPSISLYEGVIDVYKWIQFENKELALA